MSQFLTLINRTTKTLEGVWDGRHYKIAPGKNAFVEIMANKFKEQNPLMGSEDPRTGQMDYLCGIEEYNDDCTPIEQAPSIERWDRKKVGGPPVEVVKANGLYASEARSDFAARDPLNTGFSK